MKPLTEPTRYSCTERTQGDPASAAAATGLVQPIRTPPPATATFITTRDRAPARVRYIGLQTTGSHDPRQSPAKPCALEPPLCARAAVCQGAVWARAEQVNLRVAIFHEALQTHPSLPDMEGLVRLQDQDHCASIPRIIS